MNALMRCYCRGFQLVFRLAMPLLPYREPERFDSIQALPPLLERRKIRSVLLVTDRPLREAGATRPLEELLERSGVRCTVYDGTCANPTVHNVEAARERYLAGECQGLIAFGGGSPMDCAKAVGARIVYPKRSVGQMKGLLRVLRRLPPLIAIPTTAGTGSEVTITAVITDSDEKHKYTMNDFTMIPHYAVLLPIGLELYGPCVYRKLWELGRSAGVVGADTPEAEGAEAFIAAVRGLDRRLGIPETLPEIRREDFHTMAAHAAREANPLYPVPKLMDAAELERFYELAAGWSR